MVGISWKSKFFPEYKQQNTFFSNPELAIVHPGKKGGNKYDYQFLNADKVVRKTEATDFVKSKTLIGGEFYGMLPLGSIVTEIYPDEEKHKFYRVQRDGSFVEISEAKVDEIFDIKD
jgi:hypothetical protein